MDMTPIIIKIKARVQQIKDGLGDGVQINDIVIWLRAAADVLEESAKTMPDLLTKEGILDLLRAINKEFKLLSSFLAGILLWAIGKLLDKIPFLK